MSGQKSPYVAGIQSGLWRTGVWKFLLQEKQKKEKIDRVALEGIQNQINTLQARLEVFEPTVQQESKETVDKFQLSDIENDDVLDKWITFLSEGVDEMGMDDMSFADSA